MTRRVIPNDAQFAELWAGPLTTAQIGAIYGVSGCSISQAACRYDLPSRGKGWRTDKSQAPAAVQAAVEDASDPLLARVERARARGDLPAPEFWSPDRDRAVIGAGGRYREIDRLAVRWGVAAQRIVARWHRLRAA